MKKILITGALVTALLAPAGASAGTTEPPSPADFKNAAKYCKALKSYSGDAAAFRSAVDIFASGKVTEKNAYGKCVSYQAKQEASEETEARNEATQQCKAEQAQDEQTFRDAHGGQSFDEFYGTNENNRNAYGKCRSKKTEENVAQANREDRNELNAAKECKTEKSQDETEFRAAHGGESFAEFYGTNANNRNAFGKCVSQKAEAKNDEQEAAQA